ncbi:hypothetical protein SAMN04488556_3433 [Halostagnicola kamekurae]|uniref:Uncharacterized protein n=1 Tax=Halostagnicola kamekurae TaxID=619731 RepID=A0A1I6TU95_9EURY|nr:hypothetical protein SAMN04488556_3433 [Halostagnicola kamekurae]
MKGMFLQFNECAMLTNPLDHNYPFSPLGLHINKSITRIYARNQ